MESGRLDVVWHSFYTSALPFWNLTAKPNEGLLKRYLAASVVILKGDANYRRLLDDRHWPYDTDFGSFIESFWPSEALICLRTMKSGVAVGVPLDMQRRAKDESPEDWLTSGRY